MDSVWASRAFADTSGGSSPRRTCACRVPPRPDVPAGEEAQIDYGYLGKWFDPVSQRMRRVWAFVIVLAFSRHMFVRPVLVMDQRTWTACHVAAFQFFGRCRPGSLVTI